MVSEYNRQVIRSDLNLHLGRYRADQGDIAIDVYVVLVKKDESLTPPFCKFAFTDMMYTYIRGKPNAGQILSVG